MESATHRAWRLVRFTAPAVLLLGAAGGTPSVGADPAPFPIHDAPLPNFQIHEIASGLRGGGISTRCQYRS